MLTINLATRIRRRPGRASVVIGGVFVNLGVQKYLPSTSCTQDRMGGRPRPQCLARQSKVLFDGSGGQVQRSGDFLHRPTDRYMLEHLSLTQRQHLLRRGIGQAGQFQMQQPGKRLDCRAMTQPHFVYLLGANSDVAAQQHTCARMLHAIVKPQRISRNMSVTGQHV